MKNKDKNKKCSVKQKVIICKRRRNLSATFTIRDRK